LESDISMTPINTTYFDLRGQQLAVDVVRDALEQQGWPTIWPSGLDIKFYVADLTNTNSVEIPVAAVAYTFEEGMTPISSYAETEYRVVARGKKMVSGVLAMYFSGNDILMNTLNEVVGHEVVEHPLANNSSSQRHIGQTLSKGGIEDMLSKQDEAWAEQEAAAAVNSAQTSAFNASPFNLLIVNGSGVDSGSTLVLYHVDIGAKRTRIAADGQPLVEEWQFIAKNCVTKEWLDAKLAAESGDKQGVAEAVEDPPWRWKDEKAPEYQPKHTIKVNYETPANTSDYPADPPRRVKAKIKKIIEPPKVTPKPGEEPNKTIPVKVEF